VSDDAKQREMSKHLRRSLRTMIERGPADALAYIVIGIPVDRAPRVVHSLESADDSYVILRAMLDQYDAGRIVRGRPPGSTETD
jgi:hypothetical protein